MNKPQSVMVEVLEGRVLLSATLNFQGEGAPDNVAGVFASTFQESTGVTVGEAASFVAQTGPRAMSAFALALAAGGERGPA